MLRLFRELLSCDHTESCSSVVCEVEARRDAPRAENLVVEVFTGLSRDSFISSKQSCIRENKASCI